MRLLFKGTKYLPEYRGSHDGEQIHVKAGSAFEISEAEGGQLLADYPGIFVAEIEKPPVDKQIRRAPVKKSV